jgi:hypothetical protein
MSFDQRSLLINRTFHVATQTADKLTSMSAQIAVLYVKYNAYAIIPFSNYVILAKDIDNGKNVFLFEGAKHLPLVSLLAAMSSSLAQEAASATNTATSTTTVEVIK